MVSVLDAHHSLLVHFQTNHHFRLQNGGWLLSRILHRERDALHSERATNDLERESSLSGWIQPTLKVLHVVPLPGNSGSRDAYDSFSLANFSNGFITNVVNCGLLPCIMFHAACKLYITCSCFLMLCLISSFETPTAGRRGEDACRPVGGLHPSQGLLVCVTC